MTKLVAANKWGLCNRMKAIASVVHLSGKARVYWPLVEDLNCAFEKLFCSDRIELSDETHEGDVDYFASWRLYVKSDDEIPSGFSTFGSYEAGIPMGRGNPDKRDIDCEFNRIPLSVRETYVDIFKLLRPIEILQDKIDAYSACFDDNIVSVNIRTWNDNQERNELLFRIESFIEEMERYTSQTVFFLTSDSQQAIDHLREVFPERILTYPRESEIATSRFSELGMQEDLIELYLLSQNSKLIGSFLSTFTEVAWWLGGAKADVAFPLPDSRVIRYSD